MSNRTVMHRVVSLCVVSAILSPASTLKPATTSFYEDHLKGVMGKLQAREHFLLIDSIQGMRSRVKGGYVYIGDRRAEKEPPGGLIHHWEGAVFIPGVTVGQVVALVQDYDRHKNIYAPEVIDSKLLKHDGNNFQIRLRLLKKKIITVVLETEHSVDYKPIDAYKWESISRSTKVVEVDNAGSSKEHEQPTGQGHGFVWNLDSFWRFMEADGGVYVECTSLTLSRDIPFGMTRLIRPVINDLPEDSLRGVLTKTREALKK